MSDEVKPNIFLFVMDTARARNFSCYGYERETTPFLDSCASEGFKVENAVSNSIWTLPSHASMFTGMYPHEHGKLSMGSKDSFWKDTVPEKLSDFSYETVGISSNGWVSGAYGFAEIFDRFYFNSGKEWLFEGDRLINRLIEGEVDDRWESSFEKYGFFLKESFKGFRVKSLLNGAHYVLKQNFFPEAEKDWSDSGAEYTKRRIESMDFESDDPKFVFANLIEPHSPYLPPRDFAEKFTDNIDSSKETLKKPPFENLGHRDSKLADELIDFYDAEINYLDSKLEEIHEIIEQKSERDNIFIFVGDHGEMFGEDKLWEHHGGFHKSVLRVPMIVTGSDAEVDGVVELRDIHDLIVSEASGEDLKLGRENAYADYLGIGSHVWDHGFPEYDRVSVAKFSEDSLEKFSSLEKATGVAKEHLRELKILKNRDRVG